MTEFREYAPIWQDSLWITCQGKMHYTTFEIWAKKGVIKVGEIPKSYCIRPTDTMKEQMYQWMADRGYRPKNFSYICDDMITKMLIACDGKEASALEELVKAKADRLIRFRELRQKEEETWRALYSKFNGQIIGLDKAIDVYSTGFSIRVLLRSTLTTEEKRKLVKENYKDIYRWAMGEIVTFKDFRERIGDLAFYKPAEIIILKIPELEVKFEIKNMEVIEKYDSLYPA